MLVALFGPSGAPLRGACMVFRTKSGLRPANISEVTTMQKCDSARAMRAGLLMAERKQLIQTQVFAGGPFFNGVL